GVAAGGAGGRAGAWRAGGGAGGGGGGGGGAGRAGGAPRPPPPAPRHRPAGERPPPRGAPRLDAADEANAHRPAGAGARRREARTSRPASVVEVTESISTPTISPGAAVPSKFTVLLCRLRPRRRPGSVRLGPSTSTSQVRPTKRSARTCAGLGEGPIGRAHG